jgi:tetratricopeptide (TPR) repeat protein
VDPLALEREGLALKAAGRLNEAAAVFSRLVQLTPQAHGAHYNLGNTLLAAKRPAEAIEAYRRAVRLAPRFAPAHNNLGLALIAAGQPGLAVGPLTRAAALDPANIGTQHLAGHALLQSGRPDEALVYLREADRLAPGQPAITTDLAAALRRTGRFADVAPLARQAARAAPQLVEVWNNLANAERDACCFAAAEAASRHALTLQPENADAHCNLALTLLAAGDYAAAWPHWEYRWRGLVGSRPPVAGPLWDGALMGDGILYLHAEQGLGDTIQFCRYAPMAARRGRVVLAVQRPLLRLMRGLTMDAVVVATGDAVPLFAAQAPLMSLPGAFGTTLATVPAEVPYLHAEPARAAAWAARLAVLPGLRVGLVWAGNPDFQFDALRSIAPAMLNGLGDVPGVSFVSLQVGTAASGARPGLAIADWTAELNDFAETAALIAGLDLVIGVDTAAVHLAGALGRRVWLLNRFAGDWRWGMQGDGCAWYPTLRVFRQAAPGEWGAVLAAVRAALYSFH